MVEVSDCLFGDVTLCGAASCHGFFLAEKLSAGWIFCESQLSERIQSTEMDGNQYGRERKKIDKMKEQWTSTLPILLCSVAGYRRSSQFRIPQRPPWPADPSTMGRSYHCLARTGPSRIAVRSPSPPHAISEGLGGFNGFNPATCTSLCTLPRTQGPWNRIRRDARLELLPALRRTGR